MDWCFTVTHKLLMNAVNLLLRDTQIRALGKAPERHHLGLLNWIWNNKPLAPGKDAFIFQVDDFVSAARHCEKGTRLGDFIETYLNQWPESHIKVTPQT